MVTRSPRTVDRTLIGIAFFSFVVLGMPGALLNVAWSPAIRETFGLPLDAVGALLGASTGGYVLASAISGRLTHRVPLGRLLAVSALAGGLGMLASALAPTWPARVVAGLVVGVGGGLLDGVLNILFAARFGPRLMNWLHASFGIGATLAPLVMTAILARGGSWRLGDGLAALLYGVVAALFAATGPIWRLAPAETASDRPSPVESAPSGRSVATLKTNRPATNDERPATNTTTSSLVVGRSSFVGSGATLRETARLPVVWLGIGFFLMYTGVEVSAGQWAFSLLTESRGVPGPIAGVWVSAYWGSFTVGRILFGAAAHRVSPVRLVRCCMAGMAVGALVLGTRALGAGASLGLALFGLSLAPMFALMITRTQERLGPRHGPNAIGFQVAAAGVGAGLLPGLAGVLARRVGPEILPPFLLAATLLMTLSFEATERVKR